jgi:thiamine biosynthesis lipoprotein
MNYQLTRTPWGYKGVFSAMASPCELLMATDDPKAANAMMNQAYEEAVRIEHKYSRFSSGNSLWEINHARGKRVNIDAETASLLAFAAQCYQLSDGLFDISAGPLMTLWRFDGSGDIPPKSEIDRARALVDFSRVHFTDTQLTLPEGMSLDFGGIGKEYAVDRVAHQVAARWPTISVLVNFGGDICCPVAKSSESSPWQIGIENPNALDKAAAMLQIRHGALATSGDTRRFIEKDGQRFGHIIDPRSGYPVTHAPRSVTVIAPNCVTAGMLATMAMLQGPDSETFLAAQELDFKVFR